MKPWCHVLLRPSCGTQWATVLYASRHHPDVAIRERMAAKIGELRAAPLTAGIHESIEATLRGERGTPLEPFVLQEDDVEMAVPLAAAALGPPIEASRFTIVSRDSFTSDGGLVLTRGLRHYFAERYAGRTRRAAPKDAGFYAPGQEPDPEEVRRQLNPISAATIEPDPKGLAIRMSLNAAGGESDETLMRAARIATVALHAGGRSHVLRGADIAVSFGARDIVARPARPEALMRLDAATEDGGLLTIGRPGEGFVLAIELVRTDDEPKPIRIAYATEADPFAGWLRLLGWPAPPLELEEETALGRWLAPNWDWREFRVEL